MADWTLDELVRRACDALAVHDVRVPNGRVTPLPDRRVVRWYSTIGLVDRPAAYRGRTAMYGPRHLLQVVAVKRRQAEGRSIAEIQAELAGATDSTLREVAQIPEPATGTAEPRVTRPRFWAEPSAAAAAGDDRPAAAAGDDRSAAPGGDDRPAAPGGDDRPAAPGGDDRPAAGEDRMGLLYGVTLRPGVTLMLPGQPGADDLTEIRAAARPLLDLLAQRGLLTEG